MSIWIPLAVAAGGAFGSLARFATGRLVSAYTDHPFPIATLTVNILGSFLIGAWAGFLIRSEPVDVASVTTTQATWDAAIRIGLLGGLTTFSSFSLETVSLLQRQQFALAFGNIFANVLLGLAAAAAGLRLAQ